MKAKKLNKVYDIDNASKASYLKQGYDIYNDNGECIEHSPLSVVPYSEYDKVVKELEALKKAAAEKAVAEKPAAINKKDEYFYNTRESRSIIIKIKTGCSIVLHPALFNCCFRSDALRYPHG